jgi:hypothetical protein
MAIFKPAIAGRRGAAVFDEARPSYGLSEIATAF